MREKDDTAKLALITGGAGFIGARTVRALLENGWSVRVLDNLSSGTPGAVAQYLGRKDYSFIKGDITDRSILREAVRDADAVFHFAAFVSVPLSVEKPEACFQTNVAAFENLLLELRGAKTPLLYASSAAAYGDRSDGERREDEPAKPLSPYGASKAMNEVQALAAWHTWEIPSVGFRFFNVYGEGQSVKGAYASVIPKFCEALSKGARPRIFGDGGQTRDFVYVGDVARTLLSFVPLIKENSGEVFNVASGESHSVRVILDKLSEISGQTADEEILPERADDIRHSRASLDKIKSALAGYATLDIDEGLKKTYGWYKNNLG